MKSFNSPGFMPACNAIHAAIVVFLMSFLLICGCSSAGKNSISPENDINENLESLPLIAASGFDGGFSAIGLLGAYELTISDDGSSAELVPLRSPSLGQSYIVNGGSFFTITPCATCLKLKGLAFEYPYIRANFLISHPFAKGDITQPPSGKNRLDLDIFDPALIVLPLEEPPTEPHLIDSDIFSDSCGFADGYTRELAEVTGNDFACPYFLVVDDTDTGTPSNNRFEMGTKNREFSAWFKGGRFELYLTFGYGISATLANRLNPKYFIPEFNRKAAWKVNVIPPANGWSPDNTTETCDVIVEVYDWQVNAIVNPNMIHEYEILKSSEVAGVGVEITGMTDDLQIVTVPTGNHTGMPGDPLIFTVPIANENNLPGGYYTGYVKVLDKRIPPQVPSDGQVDSLVDLPDGIILDFVSMPEFATYQVFTAEVWSNDPPVADLDVSDYFIDSGMTIQMCPGPATQDPDGIIIKYEYDFDYYDGWFDVEASNTNGAPVTSPPFDNPQFGQITRRVAMRVIDDGNPEKSAVGVETITIYPVTSNRWARTWHGGNDENTDSHVISDSCGNVYVCGGFQNTVDFDPGSGELLLSSQGGADIFISKFNSNGDLLKVAQIGGISTDYVYGIICDDQDNVYVSGNFMESVDFDPGPNEVIFTAVDYGWSGFLLKLKPEGNFENVFIFEPIDSNSELAILSTCFDNSNNLLLTGRLNGTVDFNPSLLNDYHTSVNQRSDIFVTKFQQGCDYDWTFTIGSGKIEESCDLESDEIGNIYITGSFTGELDFDPNPIGVELHTAAGGGDAYLAKYDCSGDFQWAKTWGADLNGVDEGYSVAIIDSSSVVVTGELKPGLVDLDPGVGTDFKTELGGISDIFVSCFNLEGDYQWGHRIGSIGADRGQAVHVTPSGSILVAGYYGETTDFDPSPATDIRSSSSEHNGFLTKLSSSGAYQGTMTWCDSYGIWPTDLEVTDTQDIYLTGYFFGSVDFDPTSYGSDIHIADDGGDLFLCKM